MSVLSRGFFGEDPEHIGPLSLRTHNSLESV
jgi:hypothetical protein